MHLNLTILARVRARKDRRQTNLIKLCWSVLTPKTSFFILLRQTSNEKNVENAIVEILKYELLENNLPTGISLAPECLRLYAQEPYRLKNKPKQTKMYIYKFLRSENL